MLAALFAACTTSGGDAPPDTAIARLHGTLESDSEIDPHGLRVALVWYGDGHDATRRPRVAQEVEVISMTHTWPIQFELAITELPPPGVAVSAGSSRAWLVAYRDLNGNGQLDWTPVTANAFVDRIVAFHPQLVLFYFDTLGLRLILPGTTELVDPSTPITMLDRTALRSSCELLEWMPRFAFEEAKQSSPAPDDGDLGPASEAPVDCPGGQPPPETTHLACAGDPWFADREFLASWTTETSELIASVCGPVMRTCWGYRPDPTVGGPWPCPCSSQTQATCGQHWTDL